jgi:hypothetical protein
MADALTQQQLDIMMGNVAVSGDTAYNPQVIGLAITVLEKEKRELEKQLSAHEYAINYFRNMEFMNNGK